jgi:hypothetical protein
VVEYGIRVLLLKMPRHFVVLLVQERNEVECSSRKARVPRVTGLVVLLLFSGEGKSKARETPNGTFSIVFCHPLFSFLYLRELLVFAYIRTPHAKKKEC